jgi:hypothetical protein
VRVRQTAIHIVLALLLLLTQQMGVAHAVLHLSSDSVHDTANDKKIPAEAHCEQCLAYASIGSALTGDLFQNFIAAAANPVSVPVLTQRILPSPLCAFHSRAPPSAV